MLLTTIIIQTTTGYPACIAAVMVSTDSPAIHNHQITLQKTKIRSISVQKNSFQNNKQHFKKRFYHKL
jgi:hypothetical protein